MGLLLLFPAGRALLCGAVTAQTLALAGWLTVPFLAVWQVSQQGVSPSLLLRMSGVHLLGVKRLHIEPTAGSL